MPDLAARRGAGSGAEARLHPDRSRDTAEQENSFTLYLFPFLHELLPLLQRLSIPVDRAALISAQGSANGADFLTELLASEICSEEDVYRELANELGLRYAIDIDQDRLVLSDESALSFLRRPSWHLPLKLLEKDGKTSCLITPDRIGLSHLRALIARHPRIVEHLKVVSPTLLRIAVLSRVRQSVVTQATTDLFERFPAFSARIVANAWQGGVCGACLVALPGMLWAFPLAAWTWLHCFFSLFFLSCVALRFAALHSPALPVAKPARAAPDGDLPVYSVLVALYDEAEMVPRLVSALNGLSWPKSKLEIKLVCEEDDAATLEAIAAQRLPRHFEVIRVPLCGPRTKPKALAYALPLTRGDFVALYDAEDCPHSMQLIEAWRKFQDSPAQLACVQARLAIANSDAGLIARMFSFEYATLFRALLPWLSTHRLPLPLGGTSNHFRRAVLEDVGGWDPFNVTEDADLGIRLARFGYRTETIASPTIELAPDDFKTWLPQRTRWFKGWMQCWLVHMRDPLCLMRDLGPGSFLIVQILFAGMVVSALAHPFLLGTGLVLLADLALARPVGAWKSVLLAIDVVNIACGYLSFLMLGWQALPQQERRSFWRIVLFTPVYWMMMSLAAWRALWQLCRRPHHWEKTPHRAERAAASGRAL